MDVDDFAPRLSFFFNSHIDFFEELSKMRAARRIWARVMRERFKAKNPRSWWMRFHTQTAGCSLTAQQPYNNVVRTAVEALAAVLGGTQSLHTNSLDEVLCLPSDHAVEIALRTQQILAEETGVANTIDPLGGSYFIEALTDNRNRTAADVRAAFTRAGGNLGATGSVAFQFERRGEITVDGVGAPDGDELMLLVADAGGDDLEAIDDGYVVYTAPSDVMAVQAALEAAGVPVKGAELVMEPVTTTAVTLEDVKKVLRLIDRLEESDDIQNVYHTMELTDEIAAALDE
jgi:transcriptional/translational regulatory protein YebC/TACO1